MTCGIYAIQNSVNKRCYIGMSRYIEKRFATHKLNLKKGKHVNQAMQSDWDVFGAHCFEFEIVRECCLYLPTVDLCQLEREEISDSRKRGLFVYNKDPFWRERSASLSRQSKLAWEKLRLSTGE